MQRNSLGTKAVVFKKKKPFFVNLKEKYQLYLMLLPAFLLATIFCYVPLLGWVMAFTDYQLGQDMFRAQWTGFQQFTSFFSSAGDAWYTVRNTLVINLLSLFVGLFVACVFAILLNEVQVKVFKKFVQTSSFFPYFVSWVIVYMIFNSFFAVRSGVMNQMLMKIGVVSDGINFLGDPVYSWGMILFVNIWKGLGYNSVIFLAAIAGIDQEQYEAAAIDGASRFQKMIHITIPELTATLVVLLIMNSGWIFASNLEEFYLFCNDSNYTMMEVLDLYIYNYGLKYLNFSYATAVGIIKTIASILMFLLVNFTTKKLKGTAII